MKSLISWLGLDVFDTNRIYPVRNYFFGALVASIIIVVGIIIWTKQYMAPVLQGLAVEMPKEYPDDLVITIDDGVMSSSYDEPYVYSVTEFMNVSDRVLDRRTDRDEIIEAIVQNKVPENIFYIDDTRDFNLEHFQNIKSLTALYRDAFVVVDKNEIKVVTYTEFAENKNMKLADEDGEAPSDDQPFIIDQATVNEFLGETAPRMIQKILPLVWFIMITAVMVLMLLKIVPILLVALMVYLVWRTQSDRGLAKFRRAFHEVMHGSVVPFIITALVMVFTMSPAPWVFGGLLLLHILIAFLRTSKGESVAAPEHDQPMTESQLDTPEQDAPHDATRV